MNKQIIVLIPLMITLSGLLYNALTGFNGIVITTKFFPDGEDLHLGTILIWGGIASSVPLFLILRLMKSNKPHFSKEIEDAFKEQQSKKTLPQGFEKPKNGDVA